MRKMITMNLPGRKQSMRRRVSRSKAAREGGETEFNFGSD